MCTLTFLPRDDGFILTSNRDEHTQRPEALPVEKQEVNNQTLYFPKDPVGGGTWIAASKQGKCACLLNGAFDPHQPDLPYRKSRGLILLDAMSAPDLPEFLKSYNLSDIEPFTLVTFSEPPLRIFQLQWDGHKRHLNKIDASQPGIWSAPMLYPPEVRQKSAAHFRAFLNAHPNTEADDLLRFHESEKYELKMQRLRLEQVPGLQTLSTSQIIISSRKIHFIYYDLRKDKMMELIENKTAS